VDIQLPLGGYPTKIRWMKNGSLSGCKWMDIHLHPFTSNPLTSLEGGRKPLGVARKAVLRKEVKKTDGSPKGPVNKNV